MNILRKLKIEEILDTVLRGTELADIQLIMLINVLYIIKVWVLFVYFYNYDLKMAFLKHAIFSYTMKIQGYILYISIISFPPP